MKITIYELLGLIKDGKAPKKIKYKNQYYEFGYDTYTDIGVITETPDVQSSHSLFARYRIDYILDDEVEIIEDKPKVTVEMTEEEYFRYLDSKNIDSQPIEDEFIDIEEIKLGLDKILAYYDGASHRMTTNVKDREVYIKIINSLIKNQKYLKERLDKNE